MNTVFEMGKTMQGQALESLKTAQDAIVAGVGALAERGRIVGGALGIDESKQLSVFPMLGNKDVPTASEMIDSGFDFAERMLANQREFAGRIASATTAASAGN